MTLLENWMDMRGNVPSKLVKHWQNDRGEIAVILEDNGHGGDTPFLVAFIGDGRQIENHYYQMYHRVNLNIALEEAHTLARLAGMTESQ